MVINNKNKENTRTNNDYRTDFACRRGNIHHGRRKRCINTKSPIQSLEKLEDYLNTRLSNQGLAIFHLERLSHFPENGAESDFNQQILIWSDREASEKSELVPLRFPWIVPFQFQLINEANQKLITNYYSGCGVVGLLVRSAVPHSKYCAPARACALQISLGKHV